MVLDVVRVGSGISVGRLQPRIGTRRPVVDGVDLRVRHVVPVAEAAIVDTGLRAVLSLLPLRIDLVHHETVVQGRRTLRQALGSDAVRSR